MVRTILIAAIILLSIGGQLAVAQSGNTLPEKLGYPADSKLLIIHADDFGLSHSVNMATFELLKKGMITSASVMVPCPWFGEVADLVSRHPDLDIGIHLTLTSEWEYYRWGGVLPAPEIPSLLDPNGFLFPDVPDVVANAKPAEVEKECRAQIDRAIAFGLKPTHFDTHMGTLFGSPQFTEIYLRLSKDYNIPVFLPRNSIEQQKPEMLPLLEQGNYILVDRYFMATPEVPRDQWQEYYIDLVKNLEPGVTQIIVHLGFSDPELRAVTIDHPDYGAAWRQKDFDALISKEFRAALEENQVHLIGWREIAALMK